MTFLRPTLLTLACLLASPSFADDLPSLGDASSSIVSPQQEYQLGRAWLAYLRGGSASKLRRVGLHNAQDLRSLCGLLEALQDADDVAPSQ